MEIDRRQFVTLTVSGLAGVALCGCATGSDAQAMAAQSAPQKAGTTVDAGLESDYANQGVYDGFKARGFYIVRQESDLLAVSSICTHRNCKLRSEANRTFLCPCHGSKFNLDGKVTRGPATKDLPHFQTKVDDRGHLLVTL